MSDTFLSAKQLGISEREHSGLIELMQHFRKSSLKVIDSEYVTGKVPIHGLSGVGFNMDFATSSVKTDQYDCGCAACIGGHLNLIMQGLPAASLAESFISYEQTRKADRYVNNYRTNGVLRTLFYPDLNGDLWGKITALSSSYAIENTLTSGKPRWHDALIAGGQEDLVEEEYD